MNRKKLLIATHNKGKLEEFKRLCADLPVETVSLADLGITHDVEETGTTYRENAELKAKTYAKLSGMTVLADDGGLEIDALNGEPGVYSARYAGPNTTDEQKIDFLLNKMKDVPLEKRTASFVVVLALAEPDDTIEFFEGKNSGHITFEPKGKPVKGLPYRQIFVLDGRTQTIDEMGDEYESHRLQAIEKIKNRLSDFE